MIIHNKRAKLIITQYRDSVSVISYKDGARASFILGDEELQQIKEFFGRV